MFASTHIDLGPGDDAVRTSGRFERHTIEGGDGEDRMTFFDGVISTGNVSLLPGPGRDRIDFGAFSTNSIDGKLLIVDRQGPLSVTGSGLSVGRETTISTGNSIDRITLTNARFGRNVYIDTRGGNDVITFTGSRFRRERFIWPGEGDDDVIE
ncbi:MAG TPA: hypothetical protein VF595_02350 [Tepidisphaeraceae bacterium]